MKIKRAGRKNGIFLYHSILNVFVWYIEVLASIGVSLFLISYLIYKMFFLK
jgi:hypothetical protein